MSNRFEQGNGKLTGSTRTGGDLERSDLNGSDMSGVPDYSRFVADIGGTHARFALVDNSGSRQRSLVDVKVFNCADFDGPAETLIAYQEYLGHSLPDRACIAAAGPVNAGEVYFTNLDWRMSAKELRKELDIKQVEIVNDFTAVAHAVSKLSDKDIRIVHQGTRQREGRQVVVGAGTGLGVAALSNIDGQVSVIDSEGGHTRFAPADDEERELLKYLSRTQDFVSVEKLLAGPGIRSIHSALCQINGTTAKDLTAEEITSHARSGAHPDCVRTVQVYTRILASFCTNLALTFNARGGIYLVGEIFRSIEPFLTDPDFERRFIDAGAMVQMVNDTAVSLVLVEDPGLYGAAFCSINESGQAA